MTAFIPMSPLPPASIPARDVCPHCKRPLAAHRFRTGDFVNEAHACIEHGDVVPMKSAVVNAHPYSPDWSAA